MCSELLRRVERALLPGNLPLTLGGAVGGAAGLLSSTFNPFD